MVARRTMYLLVDQIEDFMGITLSTTSKPTKDQVIDYIVQAEDKVDLNTNYGWREKRAPTRRYSFPEAVFTSRRRYGQTLWFDGIPIQLTHRNVKQLDADKGDVLTIRQGSSDVNYLTDKTRGYDSDYWLNSPDGVLHVYRRWAIQLREKIEISYRYGENCEGYLSQAVGSTDTTITCGSLDRFPNSGQVYMAKSLGSVEAMYFSDRSLTQLKNVARAQKGTSALTISSYTGVPVWHVPGDITRATFCYAMIMIAQNHGLSVNENLGAGRDYIDMEERVKQWKEEADEICEKRREWLRV